MVKSKKIRLLSLNKMKNPAKHNCEYCCLSFLGVEARERHRKTVHPESGDSRPLPLPPPPPPPPPPSPPPRNHRNWPSDIGDIVTRTNTRLSEKLKALKRSAMLPNDEVRNRRTASANEPRTRRSDAANGSATNRFKGAIHSCEHCGYSCKRKYDIKRHISKIHPQFVLDDVRDVLVCGVCAQSFEAKKTLRQHILKSHMKAGGRSRGARAKGYCCDRCGRGFNTQHEMFVHRHARHVDAPPMKWSTFRVSLGKLKLCEKCNVFYRDGRFWDEHTCAKDDDDDEGVADTANAKPSFKCDQCSVCFWWKWSYRQHREIVHPDAEAKNWDAEAGADIARYCKTCFLALDEDAATVADHRCVSADVEAKPKAHVCGLCGSSYRRRSDYRRHLRFKHEDAEPNVADSEGDGGCAYRRKAVIQCPYCELTAISRSGVLAHIKGAHNIETETPFVCVVCNKVFKRKATMDTHNQVYHPKEENAEETNKILREAEILLNGELAYHCHICNRNMFNAVRFVAHYRLHHVERKFTCDLCGKQTRTQHQLNTHIKIIHLNIRNYECDICGKSFHAKQSCEEHRRIHTGERPYSCEICGKTFIAMNALFTHKKFHNDFFAHPCTMCPKKFKVRRSLINHIRTHTGERPYKCELCPKTFNNSSRFSYHKKVTHSDARPFSCSQCGSCFKANKFLMRHMKLHNVRTHIQFRRRNNPAYFAAHGSNKNPEKKPPKEAKTESSNASSYKTDDVLTSAIYNLQKDYDPDSALLYTNNDNCIMDDTKPHFLSQEFTDTPAQGNFSVSSSITSDQYQ